MELWTFVNQVLSICGGISIIGGAIAVLWRWLKPSVNLRTRVNDLERVQKKEDQSIKEIRELQAAQCQALIAIMDHEITGNHIDGLKKTKTDLLKKLTEINIDG